MPHLYRQRLIALAFCWLLAGPVQATTYYVRVAGNDACDGLTDADGASGACAKATITGAWALAACGDTIHVDQGTYTATTTTTICGSSSTIFAALTAKSCSGNHIVIEGEESADSQVLAGPDTFDASRLSIFDGNDTVVRAMALGSVIGVTIRDLAFREIKGSSTDIAVYACDDAGTTNPAREINMNGVLIHGIATAASTVDAGFILFGEQDPNGGNPSGLIANNHFITDWQSTLSFQADDTNDSDGTDSLGLIIEDNLIERAASWGSSSNANRRIVDMRHLRNVTFRDNVVNSRICSGRGAGSGESQHLFAREMNDNAGSGYIRIYGNVFSGVGGGQASGAAYGLRWQDDGTSNPCLSNSCNEKLEIYNNTCYMDCDSDTSKGCLAFFSGACNNCNLYNNVLINTIAGDQSLTNGAILSATGNSGLTDNWFWSGLGSTGDAMLSPNVAWDCDTADCADCRDGDVVCTDADTDGAGGECIAGGTTTYYNALGAVNATTFFAPAAPCTDAGEDTRCALSPGTDCDIGAFGSTAGGSSRIMGAVVVSDLCLDSGCPANPLDGFLVEAAAAPTCTAFLSRAVGLPVPDPAGCRYRGPMSLSGFYFTLTTPPVGQVAMAVWGMAQ